MFETWIQKRIKKLRSEGEKKKATWEQTKKNEDLVRYVSKAAQLTAFLQMVDYLATHPEEMKEKSVE